MTTKTVKRGAMLRIWHTNDKTSIRRGHCYVPVAKDENKQLVYLLKANSFNKDGTLHKSVKKYHKAVSYSTFGRVKLLKGVSYVDKSSRDISAWEGELFRVLPSTAQVLTRDESFSCHTKA